jgi:hypothetical protein
VWSRWMSGHDQPAGEPPAWPPREPLVADGAPAPSPPDGRSPFAPDGYPGGYDRGPAESPPSAYPSMYGGGPPAPPPPSYPPVTPGYGPGGASPGPYGAPGPQGYGYPYGYGYGYAAPANEPLAIVSLSLAVTGLVLCPFAAFISLLLEPVAIVLGVLARRRISESNGTRTGDGLALAGVIIGGISTALSVVGVVVLVLAFARMGP